MQLLALALALLTTSAIAAPLNFNAPSKKALPTPVSVATAKTYLAARKPPPTFPSHNSHSSHYNVRSDCCGRFQLSRLLSRSLPNLGHHLWHMRHARNGT